MTVSIWQEANGTTARASHDVVVVGAGLVGSYLASLLAAAGRDVALVDAHFPAAGASGRNAGFVLLGMHDDYADAVERFGHDRAQEVWSLTEQNIRRMRRLAEEHGVPYEPGGASYFASSAQEAQRLRDTARLLQDDGFEVEFVDHDPLERGFRAALQQPGDFSLHPGALTEALAYSSGARLYENDEVYDVRPNGAGLVVRARRTEFHCGQVVLALNGYVALAHPFFRALVHPVRNQVLVTESVGPLVDTLGYCEHTAHYFRQLADGRLLLGGGPHTLSVDEMTSGDEVTDSVQEALEDYLRQVFPEAAAVGVSRRWAGIDGWTRDRLPIVGSVPGEPRLLFAVGFSGHGNSLGLVAGERVAELALSGQDPGIFSAQRLSS